MASRLLLDRLRFVAHAWRTSWPIDLTGSPAPTVPRDQWTYKDIGFLAWGAVMLTSGWWLLRIGEGETPSR